MIFAPLGNTIVIHCTDQSHHQGILCLEHSAHLKTRARSNPSCSQEADSAALQADSLNNVAFTEFAEQACLN